MHLNITLVIDENNTQILEKEKEIVESSVKLSDIAVEFLQKLVDAKLPVSICGVNWFSVEKWYDSYIKIIELLGQLDFDITLIRNEENGLSIENSNLNEKWFISTVWKANSISKVYKCYKIMMTKDIIEQLNEKCLEMCEVVYFNTSESIKTFPNGLKKFVKKIQFNNVPDIETLNLIMSEYLNLNQIIIDSNFCRFNEIGYLTDKTNSSLKLNFIGFSFDRDLSKMMFIFMTDSVVYVST